LTLSFLWRFLKRQTWNVVL